MSDSFAAKNAPLIDVIRAARDEGNERAASLALQELLAAYDRLGNREAGTVDEQNAYIVARRLGSLPEVLVELGVREEDLPMPSRSRPSPPPAAAAAPAAVHADVAERFAHIGGRDEDDPPGRFVVHYRPEDNKRYKGRLCPWAIVDRDDGKPVAWYFDQDFADLTADSANNLRATG
ncbi:hypothetical protein B9W64_37550 [Streptomyces sp. CS159]|uniref:hypothetical protein n=1 Tax=Streptomyces sp. CS159 TaxID=1982762 RepID=UPI000B40D7BE|nr:hypothetical protein [Streptomyces sp. CS159]OVZ99503.1 hypothetical protein B9W64_37550 [Streptomyces sp. CS159]